MLVAEKMARIRIYVHSSFLDSVLIGLSKAEILHQIALKESSSKLGDSIVFPENTDRLFRIASSLSRARSLASSLGIQESKAGVHEGYLSDSELDEIETRISRVEDESSRILTDLSELRKAESHQESQEVEKLEQLERLRQEIADNLIDDIAKLRAARSLEEAKTKTGQTKYTSLVEGWVPVKSLDRLRAIVNDRSDGNCCIVLLESRPAQEFTGEVHQQPPTLLKNPRVATVYEKIVTAFGVPYYFEIDPTIIMLFTFPLIFGMMFGDVGQGFLLLLIGLGLFLVKRKGIQGGEMMNYVIQGSPLLVSCSLAAVFFGFLYGEAFGSEEVYEILDNAIHGLLGLSPHEYIKHASHILEEFLSHTVGFRIPIPFPFSPFSKPMTMLLVSLYVAFFHISLGLALSIVNKLRTRQFKEALAGPGVWLWFYVSFAYLLLRYKTQVFQALLRSSDPSALYMIIIPLIVMLIARFLVFRMEGLIEFGEHLIATIANTISYARILALALVHGAFSKIPWMMGFLSAQGAALIGGVAGFVFITLIAIILFEGLLSFIQTLRLHWVEWFLKFYSGTGFQYNPLRLE
jgi:V/A-type H+-transporting ATPase subunit I